jgi:hypothetical protein
MRLTRAGERMDTVSSSELAPAKARDSGKVVLWRFVTHIVVGTVTFTIVGLAAVALHLFVEWMTEEHLASWIVLSARWLEYLLFGIDASLFAIFLGRTAVSHARAIWNAEYE